MQQRGLDWYVRFRTLCMCTDIANGTYFPAQLNFFWQMHVEYRRQGKSSKDTVIE